MAGRVLSRTFAALSLSAALASLTCRFAGSNSFPSCWLHPNSITMFDSNGATKHFHDKARTSPYPGSKVERSPVPNEKVDWLVVWPEYCPVEYNAESVLAGPTWADPLLRNPVGRTGLIGRGLLGRWGPNHAADPIITRWKRDKRGSKITHPGSGKNTLQFVAIKRKDCGEWALPGGMVDPGEKISATLKREFGEEALNSLQKSTAEKRKLEKQLHKLFSQEQLVIYKGYVDDPRNTDNAWMETEAVNYHDDTGEIMDTLALEAGDDAGKVRWVDISDELSLYASHSEFIKLVAEKRDAHWSVDCETDCRGR
ncbi:ADP-ribose pyrophosphatase, mitochondrial isoform X2 [Erinaceus europaeus]|uniref:ADP-ribose pyrophosphatase, mitochondrial n=1 Tax=Erinaceus europaeus TaxID=9365 RepID=A0A1S3WLY7_ERIEU|nr:ADP-ribose pyrophosphatase, mitochondrial isoform X2 [Erinaceus europaeus]